MISSQHMNMAPRLARISYTFKNHPIRTDISLPDFPNRRNEGVTCGPSLEMQEFASGNRVNHFPSCLRTLGLDTSAYWNNSAISYTVHIPSCIDVNEDVWCYNYQPHSKLTSA